LQIDAARSLDASANSNVLNNSNSGEERASAAIQLAKGEMKEKRDRRKTEAEWRQTGRATQKQESNKERKTNREGYYVTGKISNEGSFLLPSTSQG
jgi:hypothetical protein